MSLKSIFSNSWRVLKNEGVGSVARSLLRRAKVRLYEYRYGIFTEGLVLPKDLGIEDGECHSYNPTDYDSFLKVLAKLTIRAGYDSFLDYGAGRGRVMILAARRPFKRVLGVEISPELVATARENFRRAIPRLCCRELEITSGDAGQFKVPPDVTVVFFFNPFHGTILTRVLDNLHTSLREQPRSLTVICNLPPQSPFESQVHACSWLKLREERSFGPNSRWLIFCSNDPPILECAG
jgi:SAM-dependent methyltransferase